VRKKSVPRPDLLLHRDHCHWRYWLLTIDFIEFIEQRVQLRLAFSLIPARIQWRAATAITVCHVRLFVYLLISSKLSEQRARAAL
jgi:hypothetical protein